MAVSGRKVSDFHGSVSKGSAEDFDPSCEPCLAIGKHVEAHGYCVDCREYLCKTCFAYHQRTKASKHHQLLDKDNMGKLNVGNKDSPVCTEKCLIHKNEIIKFFCTNHEFLGCTDCITLNHRTCKTDYIPDKCAGIGDSDEYRKMQRELDHKMKDIDAVIKLATLQDKQIESSYDDVIKEIIKFRKEINDRLDQLQKQIQADADKKKLKDKQTVKNVLDTAVSSYIKKFKSDLQDNKSSQQDGQLYIMIKKAKSTLKLDDLKNAQDSLDQTSVHHTFERNKELENIFTKQDIFGKWNLSTTLVKKEQLSIPTTPVTQIKKKVFDKFTHSGDINVKTKSDKTECFITGCAVLSSHKVMLADYSNSKLKVVDTQSELVTEEKSLHSKPRDIAVLPMDQIAVTMPKNTEVLVMSPASKFLTIRRIPVKGVCKGITYHQGQLYVLCWDSDSAHVHIADIQGNVNNMISLDKQIFASPQYLLLSKDARHIYISNYGSKSVVSVTLQGDISAVYKHQDLFRPLGMMILDDGSLLVCSCNTSTIHQISGDLKQGQTVLYGLQGPWSICYNQHEQEVYIGGQCDQLKIMK